MVTWFAAGVCCCWVKKLTKVTKHVSSSAISGLQREIGDFSTCRTACCLGAAADISMPPRQLSPVLFALLYARGGTASEFVDWRYFAAGGVAAALSHGYTTPIDVVKTRMQTNPELGNSVVGATRTLIKAEGLPFLLQGLAPTCAGYGAEGALKFGCYEICKPLFSKVTPHKMVNMLLASVVAGAVASIVLCPAEEIRIKQVSDPAYADSGTVDTFRRLSAEKG